MKEKKGCGRVEVVRFISFLSGIYIMTYVVYN